MSANLYVIEDYENEPPSGPKKQTQTNPISNPTAGSLVRAGLIRSERVRVKGKVRLFKVFA